MAVATEIFQNYGDGGKRGVKMALNWTIDYFVSRGVPHAALKPLEAVMAALTDADNGVASPIFKLNRKRVSGGMGRPKQAIPEREFRGFLAVVTQCCIEHERREGARDYKKQGCNLAAKMINTSNWPTKVTPAQLSKIRETVAGSETKSPERIFWNETMQSEGYAVSPLGWAKSLLVSELLNLPPKESP